MKVNTRTEIFLLLICVPLALILISPLFHVLMRAGEVNPQKAIDYFSRSGTLAIIGRSLLLVAAVSFTSCLIAVPAAWLTMRTDLIGRNLWTILLILPLVIPSYIGAFAMIGAIGQKGFLQGWLEDAFGVQRLPSIYGLPGSWLSITLFTYPYVFISVRAGLRGIDPTLEEASRLLGKSAFETFWRVTFPQLRPFIAAGGLLVALYTLGEFGAVSVMQYDVFSRAIYFQLNFDRGQAALLSLVLVVFTIAIMLVAIQMEGRGKKYYTRGVRRYSNQIALGRWQIMAQLFCFLLVLLALFMPLSVIA
ncbi:MAG TPA: ABC transporter permease subunit, partial [Aggregatilineales bacterium]|nr:ABC transporter permease subunit [Aggregatilineales bacterium]